MTYPNKYFSLNDFYCVLKVKNTNGSSPIFFVAFLYVIISCGSEQFRLWIWQLFWGSFYQYSVHYWEIDKYQVRSSLGYMKTLSKKKIHKKIYLQENLTGYHVKMIKHVKTKHLRNIGLNKSFYVTIIFFYFRLKMKVILL